MNRKMIHWFSMWKQVQQIAAYLEDTEGTKVRGSTSLLWAAPALKDAQHQFQATGQEWPSLRHTDVPPECIKA